MGPSDGCAAGNTLRAVLLVVFLSVFNITGGELVIIAILALIVLGPDKLPDFVRRAGRVYGEIKKMSTGFKTEFRDVIEEPVREMQDTVNLAKSWFDEGRTAIETMDDSKWGTPAPGAAGEPEASVHDTQSSAAPADAFGSAPVATSGNELVAAPDAPDSFDASSGPASSGSGVGLTDVDGEADDDDAVDETDDDPNFYDSNGNMIDLTRVDSFLQIEESTDSFGSVARKTDSEGPAA